MITQNSKIKDSGLLTYNFGIPAFISQTGIKTCPNAGRCAGSCYARQGFFNMTTTKGAYERRLEFTKDEKFVADIIEMINKKKVKAFRWNDSGDFYSMNYLKKAFEVMRQTPTVQHYAYTKQVKMLKEQETNWPENFTVIYSLGGKQDALIDLKHDKHSKVFPDLKSLKAAKYVDASRDDSLSWRSKSNKIGLVYHGIKKSTF